MTNKAVKIRYRTIRNIPYGEPICAVCGSAENPKHCCPCPDYNFDEFCDQINELQTTTEIPRELLLDFYDDFRIGSPKTPEEYWTER